MRWHFLPASTNRGSLMPDTPAAIDAQGLSKDYPVFRRPQDRLLQMLCRGKKRFFHSFSALKDVSLRVNPGETVGIVGCNGSGKSTLLQLICGTLTPTAGTVQVNGRVSALLELGAGFNPNFSGKENIYLNGAILGLSRKEIDAKYDDIVAFSGLRSEAIDQPVKTYSSGMYVRLAFAVAIASDPDILIIDEALAVGDEAFQRKCFGRLRDIQQRGGTILFVSHSSRTVTEICDRAILLDRGEMLMDGAPKEVISRYQKLIFAPADQYESVRNAIIKGKDPNITVTKKSKKEAPHHDPALVPESRVEHEPKGAQIFDVTLTDNKDNPVNLLEKNSTVCYRYRVRFDVEAENVRFGMLIKTKSGVELGGASQQLEQVASVAPGDVYDVTFRFQANLLEGTYFLNCGCSGIVDGERTFLHRIHDALMFKILPDTNTAATGMIDFLPEVTVTEAQNA